jgi:hypothetical protein
MKDLKKKKEELKQEIINVLKEKDLTDDVIFIRDEISNFTGTCIDGEVGGLCTKIFITSHTGTEISLMDEFEEELGTFNLNDFGIDFLLTLLD